MFVCVCVFFVADRHPSGEIVRASWETCLCHAHRLIIFAISFQPKLTKAWEKCACYQAKSFSLFATQFHYAIENIQITKKGIIIHWWVKIVRKSVNLTRNSVSRKINYFNLCQKNSKENVKIIISNAQN